MNGINALIKGPQGAPLNLPPTEVREKTAVCDLGSGCSPDTGSSSTLIWDFPSSRTMRNFVCSVSLPACGVLAITARTKTGPSRPRTDSPPLGSRWGFRPSSSCTAQTIKSKALSAAHKPVLQATVQPGVHSLIHSFRKCFWSTSCFRSDARLTHLVGTEHCS